MSYNIIMQREKSLEDIGYGSMMATYTTMPIHLKKIRKSKRRIPKYSILICSTHGTTHMAKETNHTYDTCEKSDKAYRVRVARTKQLL